MCTYINPEQFLAETCVFIDKLIKKERNRRYRQNSNYDNINKYSIKARKRARYIEKKEKNKIKK